jgi:hypothetical protein
MNPPGCLQNSLLQPATRLLPTNQRNTEKSAVQLEVAIAMSGLAKIFLALDRKASVIELNAVGLIYF